MSDATQLTIDLHDDGIDYRQNGCRIRVQGKNASRTPVTIIRQSPDTGAVEYIPTETGNLGSGSFREKLLKAARERFGDAAVSDLRDILEQISVVLPEHLKERDAAAAEDVEEDDTPAALKEQGYRIRRGGFWRVKYTQAGELPQRLTNFIARVDEQVIRDDGAEAKRYYHLSGEAGEKRLPKAEVPAATFPTMNWIADQWGLDAQVAAGPLNKDYTREAIELMSEAARIRYTYQHLGWRTLADGKRVYLSGSGAVDHPGVEVSLDSKFKQYKLPQDASVEEIHRGIRSGLEFLKVAPLEVTVPLLAVIYLAPLAEIVTPDFVLWVWGGTGSFKSTLAALALCHYGEFDADNLQMSFESTANAIERELFLLKDTPALVDDWRPSISKGDEAEMAKKAQRLLRGVGNQQGRDRMNADSSLRESYPPRGAVIATAEGLPEGPAFESAISRSLAVHLKREQVDIPKLTELQREQKDAKTFGAAMLGYIRHLTAEMPDARKEYEEARARFRQALPEAHPRLPGALAALSTGLWAFLNYAQAQGVLDEAEAAKQYVEGLQALARAGALHLEATSGGDPASQFLRLLSSQVAARSVHFRDKATDGVPGGEDTTEEVWEPMGWERAYIGKQPKSGSKFAGWVDDDYFYLDKDAAYAAIQAYAKQGDIPFGIKPRALWEALAKSGKSMPAKGRTDTPVRINGKMHRVVQIPRFEVEGHEV